MAPSWRNSFRCWDAAEIDPPRTWAQSQTQSSWFSSASSNEKRAGFPRAPTRSAAATVCVVSGRASFARLTAFGSKDATWQSPASAGRRERSSRFMVSLNKTRVPAVKPWHTQPSPNHRPHTRPQISHHSDIAMPLRTDVLVNAQSMDDIGRSPLLLPGDAQQATGPVNCLTDLAVAAQRVRLSGSRATGCILLSAP